jgi:hypothetical protein
MMDGQAALPIDCSPALYIRHGEALLPLYKSIATKPLGPINIAPHTLPFTETKPMLVAYQQNGRSQLLLELLLDFSSLQMHHREKDKAFYSESELELTIRPPPKCTCLIIFYGRCNRRETLLVPSCLCIQMPSHSKLHAPSKDAHNTAMEDCTDSYDP